MVSFYTKLGFHLNLGRVANWAVASSTSYANVVILAEIKSKYLLKVFNMALAESIKFNAGEKYIRWYWLHLSFCIFNIFISDRGSWVLNFSSWNIWLKIGLSCLSHLERWVWDEATAVALVEKSQLKVAMVPCCKKLFKFKLLMLPTVSYLLPKFSTLYLELVCFATCILYGINLGCVILKTILFWCHLKFYS